MNPTLLQQQFERLSRNPGDVRLLKQLAVELGASLIRSKPEAIRAYRVAAASALHVFEAAQENDPATVKARAALETLLDTAASAEDALTAERDREEVRSVASHPRRRVILRALLGKARTTKDLSEEVGRVKSQVSADLSDLERVGLVCPVERVPNGNQKEKPYRLTLSGATILDELPKDEVAPRSKELPVGEKGAAGDSPWEIGSDFDAIASSDPFAFSLLTTGLKPTRGLNLKDVLKFLSAGAATPAMKGEAEVTVNLGDLFDEARASLGFRIASNSAPSAFRSPAGRHWLQGMVVMGGGTAKSRANASNLL